MSVAAGVSRVELARKAGQFPTGTFYRLGGAATLVGGAVLIWGLAGAHAPRTWWAYHANFVFWVAIAQAMVVLAATQKLARGHWSGLMIRFAEAGAAFTAAAPVLFLGLFLGRAHIFPWIHEPRPDLGWWLTSPAFFLRNGAILAGLAWLSWRFVRHDLAPDIQELANGRPPEPDAGAEATITREAAFVVLGYAVGYSLLGFDLIMSLAHKWVSNLFGAFYFMGSFLGALGATALLTLAVRRPMGIAELVSPKQLHDIGKLIFGFTVFWAYLMWSQFLVIWYGNLPEETHFVFYRLWGPWLPVGTAVFLMVFVIPFVGLLGVKPKKYAPTLAGFTLVSLAGIWLERYLEVVPSINHGAGPAIGVPELGVALFYFGLFLLGLAWFAGRYPMLSPRLAADTIEREGH
ncbi:MAG TPA: hypothetical protein VNI61_07545 [Gemmatimonadales bacterium]|nr:hypothetical protein [Gemmatimonadales bacterium]